MMTSLIASGLRVTSRIGQIPQTRDLELFVGLLSMLICRVSLSVMRLLALLLADSHGLVIGILALA